jgi:RNA polymerase sigma factor for flagellar operon FliA
LLLGADQWLAGSSTSPSGRILNEEMQRDVVDSLRCLDEKDRQILELRYSEQRSFADIATAVGLSEDAAKKHHARALMKLNRLLKRDATGDPR